MHGNRIANAIQCMQQRPAKNNFTRGGFDPHSHPQSINQSAHLPAPHRIICQASSSFNDRVSASWLWQSGINSTCTQATVLVLQNAKATAAAFQGHGHPLSALTHMEKAFTTEILLPQEGACTHYVLSCAVRKVQQNGQNRPCALLTSHLHTAKGLLGPLSQLPYAHREDESCAKTLPGCREVSARLQRECEQQLRHRGSTGTQPKHCSS